MVGAGKSRDGLRATYHISGGCCFGEALVSLDGAGIIVQLILDTLASPENAILKIALATVLPHVVLVFSQQNLSSLI